jgi:hypothetical protein
MNIPEQSKVSQKQDNIDTDTYSWDHSSTPNPAMAMVYYQAVHMVQAQISQSTHPNQNHQAARNSHHHSQIETYMAC